VNSLKFIKRMLPPAFETLDSRVFLSAGNLDPAFNHGELVITPFANGSSVITDIEVLPDGGFLAAGTVRVRDGTRPTDRTMLAIAKYHFDGTLDTSFGVNGKIENTPRGLTGAIRLQLTPDGGFIVMGNYETNADDADFNGNPVVTGGGTLLKFTSSGRVDTHFAKNGVLKPGRATTFTVDQQGRILVGGWRDHPVNATDAILTRYTSGGALDTSFADNGQFVSVTPVTGEDINRWETFNSVAIDSQGRVVAGLEVFDTSGGDENTENLAEADETLIRFSDNGEVDSSYVGQRITTLRQIAGVLDDGSALLIGKTIARVGANGQLDSSYGNDGVANTDQLGVGLLHILGGQANDRFAVSPDGSIVFANIAAPGRFELTRIDAQGDEDGTFGTGGTLTVGVDNDVHAQGYLSAVNLAPDASLVVGGQSGILSPTGRTDTREFVTGRVLTEFGPHVQLVPRTLKAPSLYLYITVLIRDTDGVDLATLDDFDLKLMDSAGHARRFQFHGSQDLNGDGTSIAARYRMKGPGNAAWNSAGNGDYDVRLQKKQISNLNGNVATARTLGAVRVNIG
jgi:uncharacterized delta-60 repeat protein